MEEERTVRKGLVCEGGAMRGMFTAGVLDVFLEEGITFDGMVGVSAEISIMPSSAIIRFQRSSIFSTGIPSSRIR